MKQKTEDRRQETETDKESCLLSPNDYDLLSPVFYS